MIKKITFKRLLTTILIICFMLMMPPAYSFAAKTDTLAIGKSYSGFKLVSEKYISEIQSNVMIFNHEKSGAKLLFLQNDDTNKVFSIAFRTLATDNTGVNHIIEHSVFDGSANYPVKSPLSEMSKRSLNTFLNAYTASDRTIFPVASRNKKDFNNLMEVYLDAVFYPNVLKDKKIFMQEAGHYEMDSKTSDLTYKGVVYNEMKGNQSLPNSILADEINKSLFPDTDYKWNSGGTPEAIPTLTWEKLKETYNKNYNPSNSDIYLYGNVNIKETLKIIDSKYLSKFAKKIVNNTYTLQKPFTKQKEVSVQYPIAKSADPNNRTFLSMNFVTDKITNKDDAIGLMFLNYMLLGNNSAPLKNAMLSSGICSNVYGNINNNDLQTSYSIIAENTNYNQKNKFVEIINNTLNRLVKSGLDKDMAKALAHSYEINLRASRSDANRGITYNDLVMSTWLNGGDPTQYLTLNDCVNKIKNSLSGNYFENLIKKYLINNKLSSVVVLKPVPGLSEKMDADIKAALKNKKSKLTAKDIDEIIKQTAEIKKWQSTPNSSASMAKLPSLNVSDIEKQSQTIPIDVKGESGIKVLNHSLFTDKVIYSDLYFDTSAVPQNKLEYLYLLSIMLGGLDTQNYNYTQLANKIGNSMGSISFVPSQITKFKDMNTYYPKFNVSFYTLDSDIPAAFKVVNEIINNTKYDNKVLLKQYIKITRSSLDNNIIGSGMDIASGRVKSYYSECGRYVDLGSLPFYNFIIDLDNNFNAKSDEITKNLKEVADLVFNKRNMVVGVTCDSDEYSKVEKSLNLFISKLKNNDIKPQVYKFDNVSKNEGFKSTSQVQYIAQGYDFNKLGYDYSGKMLVLKSILDGDYIWNRVRELGGAYGGSFNISRNGNAEFLSWSDPNLKETLDVFSKAGDFIKNLSTDDKELENYIISTIGVIDKPMSPSEKGKASDLAYFSGIKQNDIQKERNEILSTTIEDIKNYGDMLNKITEQRDFCIFGNQGKINDNKDIFNSIIDVAKN